MKYEKVTQNLSYILIKNIKEILKKDNLQD